MDLRKLKTLIDLVAESDIKELEVTEGDSKVRIAKSSATPQNQVVMMQPQAAYPETVHASAPVEVLTAAAPVADVVPEDHIIKSPMVGTFYRSSAPGAPPFAEVGKEVREGETICIIEAMKLLNEIDAARAGVVRQILVENGQPVEFGQPLFVID